MTIKVSRVFGDILGKTLHFRLSQYPSPKKPAYTIKQLIKILVNKLLKKLCGKVCMSVLDAGNAKVPAEKKGWWMSVKLVEKGIKKSKNRRVKPNPIIPV